MKRLLLIAGLAIGALGFAASPVLASNAATTVKFTATYAVGAATWTCSGKHIDNHGIPGSQDNETCLVTGDVTGYVAGTYTGTLGAYAPCADGNVPPIGDALWNSDYPPILGLCSNGWTIIETDNGNGTFTVAITAFYPVP
jgi:hypothetical protein